MPTFESHSGLAILVVEDEALIKMMICDMLEELGIRSAARLVRSRRASGSRETADMI